VLSLPSFCMMTKKQQDYVVEEIRDSSLSERRKSQFRLEGP